MVATRLGESQFPGMGITTRSPESQAEATEGSHSHQHQEPGPPSRRGACLKSRSTSTSIDSLPFHKTVVVRIINGRHGNLHPVSLCQLETRWMEL